MSRNRMPIAQLRALGIILSRRVLVNLGPICKFREENENGHSTALVAQRYLHLLQKKLPLILENVPLLTRQEI
jgi:hypothetical protein